MRHVTSQESYTDSIPRAVMESRARGLTGSKVKLSCACAPKPCAGFNDGNVGSGDNDGGYVANADGNAGNDGNDNQHYLPIHYHHY